MYHSSERKSTTRVVPFGESLKKKISVVTTHLGDVGVRLLRKPAWFQRAGVNEAVGAKSGAQLTRRCAPDRTWGLGAQGQ